MKLALRQAYDTVVADIRAAETNAVVRNKPTLFAYFGEVGDQFFKLSQQGSEWLYDVVDNQIVNEHSEPDEAMLERVLRKAIAEANKRARMWYEHGLEHPGQSFTYEHDRTDMAQLWSVSIYAEKALRLAGFRLRKRSLDWLRAQRRWPDADGRMPERLKVDYSYLAYVEAL